MSLSLSLSLKIYESRQLLAMVILLLLLAFAWKCLCYVLRHRRSKLVARLHPSRDHHALVLHTSFVEFPLLTRKALEFGLFRTYAIPQISRVLQKSGQFAQNASKRYDDTDILVQELVLHHVDGDRGSLAVRRLNFLHSRYPINNSEYLYVLSVFVLLPMEWAALYGHRVWTELETSAHYTNWCDIGTRMGIRDIPESISAFSTFKENYEAKHMVYADSNREIAEATVALFLGGIPSFLRPMARRIVYALFDDRLRKAMGYPRQPWWLRSVSHGLLKLHGMVVSWLPPRPLSWAKYRILPSCPKFQGAGFDAEALRKVLFQAYKPAEYRKGYKIKELGASRPGELGKAQEGKLFCPLNECSNSPWPQSFTSK